ncbi:hypothetical protein Y032_0031g2333 [Ancylostoma ceylanicum]|uniref:SCP domain-containing protein n=1 Tax=Ancylostoma ceylanicum TaxID=53326 RepID=A0A016URR8_9BILA|nr:hypothetical protein Y032_0031g2333 [Ancylostoma ceylanicum]
MNHLALWTILLAFFHGNCDQDIQTTTPWDIPGHQVDIELPTESPSTSLSPSTVATESSMETTHAESPSTVSSVGPESTESTPEISTPDQTSASTTPSATTSTSSSSDPRSGSTSTERAETTVKTASTRPTRRPWPKPNCGSDKLSNELRDIFLHLHNTLRGSLARGQDQKSAGWGIAPPATLMYRMKYDCDAESYAIQYVSSCQTRGLPAHTHPGYKVNSYVFRDTSKTKTQVLKNVVMHWWVQLSWYGMRSNMMFYQSELNRGPRNVLNWSKMAWWNNRHLGCAIQKCNGFYYVACMYKPGGNNVGQHVYKVGALCSECPKGQCDGEALCRW